MNEKYRIWIQIIIILILGLVISVASDGALLGAVKTLWQESDPEALLEDLSLGLGFLALVGVTAYLVFRASREE